jgi:hypothetical protein
MGETLGARRAFLDPGGRLEAVVGFYAPTKSLSDKTWSPPDM